MYDNFENLNIRWAVIDGLMKSITTNISSLCQFIYLLALPYIKLVMSHYFVMFTKLCSVNN